MSRIIFCNKLQKELEGLSNPPYPNALGQKIFDHISAQAWQQWLDHQTMFINEYRLNLVEPEARKFLLTEMQKFLFEGANQKPEVFTEQQ